MRLGYERVGSGAPLVLLHGVGHRRQAWYPVLDQLAAQREVILVDLPGARRVRPAGDRGSSGRRRPGRRVARVPGRPAAGTTTHVAGNSLGGRIALEAAAAGDARSVTALSPAGFWPTERAFGYTRRLFATVSRVSQLLEPQAERLARTSWGRIVACGWITAHPTRIEPDQALGDFRAFRRAQPALRELVAGATRFSSVIAPDVPVTIAWATRDAVLPRNQANVARALLPHAEHILLPGCGHVPMSDDPRRVAGVILRGSADGWQPRRGANGRKRTTA